MIDQNMITEARRTLGQRLAAFRQAAKLDQHKFAALTHYSRSSLANVETGRQKGTRNFWQLCDDLLHTGGALTTAFDEIEAMVRQRHQEIARRSAAKRDPTQFGIQARVARAAEESQVFAARWESRCLSRETADEFGEDLSRLSAEYLHRPLDGLFDELVAVRDRACDLLGRQRRTSDTRGLLFIAGIACSLLAHASIDLGDYRSAAHQARVASRLAAEAGHNGLLAWALGTQSLVAYGLCLPDKAVEFACRGEAYATSTNSTIRLAALKARGNALWRHTDAARQALTQAQTTRDSLSTTDELDTFGGLFVFPLAKQHYYAGSTAALVRDGVTAEVYAQDAITAYQTGPENQRSYGDLALSRAYLAEAHLLKPSPHQDLAAAGEALRGVLELPPEQRIAGLYVSLRRLQTALDREPVRRAAEARDLHAQLGQFLAGSRTIPSV